MNRKSFQLVIALAVISISGILFIQIFWMGKAFDLRDKQFSHNVNMALLNVITVICEINQSEILPDPIERLSSNYFIVNINNRIAPSTLETVLKREFLRREITENFEYAVFDCVTEEMVYGKYVVMENMPNEKNAKTSFPILKKDAYYFGVYFPNKPSNLAGEMRIWAFSTTVLIIVILFFGYTLFAIFKQKQLSEIQKDFINNMTHEFKTPISTIALSSAVLASDEILQEPERLHKYVGIIQKETTRLQNQVDKVLQMASVEKNAIELKLAPIDVIDLIQQVIQSASLSLAEKEGRIEFLPQANHSMVNGDQLHLTNIIYNLLDNAVKYNLKAPEIIITTQSVNHKLCISIQDNGKGIDKKERDLIFKKFYRVSTGNLHDVKGFGLGLYYVKMMVEAHQGQISLVSSDAGSTFTITLPQL